VWQQLGDRVGIGWTLSGLASAARAQGKFDLAQRRIEESMTVWRELGDKQNTANVLTTSARLARDRGQYSAAQALLAESLRAFRDLGDRRGIAFALEGFAGLAADQGRPLDAHCLAAAATTLRRAIGAVPPPSWRADLEGSLSATHGETSGVAIEGATARGSAMTMAEAIAFALDHPASRPEVEPGAPQ
jgi:tetratricopeptide (TPR) repeat protein